ncbi:MAG: hypothetical protein JO362_24905 [Streptomycetaceae bacterium]|nr:hypothetical protein [Streptomycetaceae bacterium]
MRPLLRVGTAGQRQILTDQPPHLGEPVSCPFPVLGHREPRYQAVLVPGDIECFLHAQSVGAYEQGLTSSRA